MNAGSVSQILNVQQALDAMVGAVFITDKNGFFRYCNHEFYNCLGNETKDLVGHSIDSVFNRSVTEIVHSITNSNQVKNVSERQLEIGPSLRWYRCYFNSLKTDQPLSEIYLFNLLDIDDYITKKQQLVEAQSVSKVGSWHLDLKTQKQTWSSEHYKIFEIPEPQDQKVLYKMYRDRIHPDDIEKLDFFVSRAMNNGEDFIYDHRVFLDSGKRIKYVKGIGKVVRDSNGTPLFAHGTCQDLTAEYESQRSFRSLIKTMNDGWVIHDSSGAIVDYNSAALTILGLSKDELLGKTSMDPTWKTVNEEGLPFPGDQHPAMVALKTDKPVQGVIMGVRSKNKKLNWIKINASPFDAPEGKRVTVTFTDITEIVNKNIESKFLFESLKIGNWKFFPKTNELIWDKSMYQLFEIEEANFSGHYSAWEKSLSTEAKRDAIKDLELALQGKKEFNTSFEIVTAAGKRKMIGGRGVVIKDADGSALEMIGINWDRTAEHNLKMELEEANAKSIHTAKLASLGEMAAGMAHEINNPLTIISGYLFQLEKVRFDSVQFASKVNTINSAIKRIVKIINGLRDFSRTPAQSERSWHLIENVVNEALVFCNAKAKLAGVRIEIEIENNIELMCDLIEIEQVLVNLINNAIDAISDLNEKWIKIVSKMETDHVFIQIIDSGNGISKQNEKKLFQPFFTTKPVGKGTGLGLSISKNILSGHNAEIFYNRECINTCFVIKFPKSNKVQKAA